MSIKETAKAYHDKGFNCAQSVLSSCGKYTGLDEKTALAIGGGFGLGVRSGEICGAISGAVMAIGLANPFIDGSDLEAKRKVTSLTVECTAAAKEKFGCIRCCDLKGDYSNCPHYIQEMADIAEEIINNNK
ncbi:MAG: C-GCAxxG-C-C family protein [Bacillota bacterium]|nr:C-GCAxxG-C-C family protein [Bacillota bacterium]